MGYICPVCEDPQADGEHLANHLAFTAMLGDDAHDAWLDEHAPDWPEYGPEALAERVVDHAEEGTFPQVFEDTTGTTPDHSQADSDAHRHEAYEDVPLDVADDGLSGVADPPDAAAPSERAVVPDPPRDGDVPSDADGQSDADAPPDVLSTARELTRRRRERAEAGDATDGTDDATDGTDDATDGTDDTGASGSGDSTDGVGDADADSSQ